MQKYKLIDEDMQDDSSIKNVAKVAEAVEPSPLIRSENNEVWFYSEINQKSALKLIELLKTVEKNILTACVQYDIDAIPIKLYIHSPGGYVTSSFALASYIKNMKVPVHTIIDSWAASGATILSVSGAKRIARQNSYVMIHQLSGAMWGSFENMKDDFKNVKLMMADIINHYVKHTKIEEKELKKMLKRDIYFSAEKCLELGLIDEII